MQLVDAGIDWITATISDVKAGNQALNHVHAMMRSEERLGNAVEPWRMHGYSGWQCGHVASGERPDGLCVQVTSEAAHDAFSSFAPLWSNVSRLDVQLTVLIEGDVLKANRRIYEKLKANRYGRQGKLECLWIENSAEGSTSYCGAASSDQRGRVYDKGRESGLEQFRNCLRFEGQFRRRRAWDLAMRIHRQSLGRLEQARIIGDWFRDRGGPSALTEVTKGCNLDRLNNSCLPAKTRSCAVRTDALRSYDFLRRQARSTAQWLVYIGQSELLLDALGLAIDASSRLIIRDMGQDSDNN